MQSDGDVLMLAGQFWAGFIEYCCFHMQPYTIRRYTIQIQNNSYDSMNIYPPVFIEIDSRKSPICRWHATLWLWLT